ncbi:hypothetical protein GCM10023108_52370 [Saccharopolyspora hordei]
MTEPEPDSRSPVHCVVALRSVISPLLLGSAEAPRPSAAPSLAHRTETRTSVAGFTRQLCDHRSSVTREWRPSPALTKRQQFDSRVLLPVVNITRMEECGGLVAVA